MKLSLVITTIFCAASLSIKAQIPINKEWVSKNLDYIKLNKTHAYFQFNGHYQEKGYHIYGDTLRMQDWYYSSNDNYKTLQHTDFDFLTKLNKDILSLTPINGDAVELSKQAISFTPIENYYLKSFNYDLIKFTSSTCYGECPEVALEIKARKVIFIGGKHATKQGKYSAYLSKELHEKLLSILKKSSFDRLQNNKMMVIDAPTYSISITRDNQSKTISGERLPILLKPLLDFLRELPKLLNNEFVPLD